jgi:hypothetical protein
MSKQVKISTEEFGVIKELVASAKKKQDYEWMLPLPPDGVMSADMWFMDRPAMYQALTSGRYWEQWWRNDIVGAVARSCNKILPKLKAEQDTLCSGVTTIFCEPRGERWQGQEKQDAAYLKSVAWDESGAESACPKARWDMRSAYGFGVVKFGWYWERGGERMDGERGEAAVSGDASPIALDGDQMMMDQGEIQLPEGMDPETAQRQATVESSDLAWGEPRVDTAYAKRISPRRFLVDPNASSWDLTDARFVCEIEYEIAEKVRQNPKYDAKVRADVTGSYYALTGDSDKDQNIQPLADATVEECEALARIYHFYGWRFVGESKTETFLHIAYNEGDDKPLLSEDNPYDDERGNPLFGVAPGQNVFRYEVIPGDVVDNDTFYPQCAVEQAANIQIAHDESYEQLNNHRKISNRMYAYQKDLLDESAIELLQAGKDNTWIPVNNARQFSDSVVLVPQADLQPEVFQTMATIDPDMERALGVNATMEGTTPQRKQLKAEVVAQQQQGSTPVMGEGEKYKQFRTRCAIKLMLLHMRFGDRKREFSYSMSGKTDWGQMNAEDLRGNRLLSPDELEPIGLHHNIKVEVDSEAHKNRQSDQQMKISWFKECIAPFAGMPDTDDPAKKLVDFKAALKVVSDSMEIPNTQDIIAPTLSEEEKAAKNTPANLVCSIVQQNPQLAPLIMQFIQQQAQQAKQGQHGQPGGNGGQQPPQQQQPVQTPQQQQPVQTQGVTQNV